MGSFAANDGIENDLFVYPNKSLDADLEWGGRRRGATLRQLRQGGAGVEEALKYGTQALPYFRIRLPRQFVSSGLDHARSQGYQRRRRRLALGEFVGL
jgi:hypothetical protein